MRKSLFCAIVASISAFAMAAGDGIVAVVTGVLDSGKMAIPSSWAEQFPQFESKFGSDFAAALLKPSGKIGSDGSPLYVWQDYVAGTDPTDTSSVFSASIVLVNGKVSIECRPHLDDAKAPRLYQVWGKKELTDTSWVKLTSNKFDGYHYFKVTVEMIGDEGVSNLPESGPIAATSVVGKFGRELLLEEGKITSNTRWGDFAFGENGPKIVFGGHHMVAYPVQSGDRLLINANDERPSYIALLSTGEILPYGYDPAQSGTWMQGEVARRKIMAGETQIIEIPQDGYVHVTTGYESEGYPNFPKRLEIVSGSSLLNLVSNMSQANALSTTLRGKGVVLYGDSFANYTNERLIADGLGCEVFKQGIGGCPVGNNTTANPLGLCSFERISLFPKTTRLIIVLGGVNDYCRSVKNGVRAFDPEKLGTMEDPPLSVEEMICESKKTTTFYQAYKTMLRNMQLLYPEAIILCVMPHKWFYLETSDPNKWSDRPVLAMDGKPKVDAMREIAESFSFPVCDLWRTSGVNEYNAYDRTLNEEGFWGHSSASQRDRDGSLILNSIMNCADRTDVKPVVTTGKNKDQIELGKWFLDLRSDNDVELTLEEAIESASAHFKENGVELKNRMHIVFRCDGVDVGYVLIDAASPHRSEAWQEIKVK